MENTGSFQDDNMNMNMKQGDNTPNNEPMPTFKQGFANPQDNQHVKTSMADDMSFGGEKLLTRTGEGGQISPH